MNLLNILGFATFRPPAPVERIRLADETSRPDGSDVEIGATGTAFFRGLIKNEEFNTDLQGIRGAAIYEKMRRSDGQVKAILNAIKLPIRSASWKIECLDNPNVEDFLGECFEAMDWETTLQHILTMVDFGYWIGEKVWGVRDGKVILEKIAHRAQSTVYEWKVDEKGDLASVVQYAWKNGVYGYWPIPAEKLFHVALEMEGNNFEGISALRPAYKHWFIKDAIYRIDAIAHERFGIGVPDWELAEGYTPADKAAAETICQDYKAGNQAYIVRPPGHKFGIVGTGEGARYDPHPSIKHHDEMIARAFMAQFLNYGTTQTGSRALGGESIDMFLDSLKSLAGYIGKQVDIQIIRPLLAYNFPGGANIEAHLRYSGIGKKDVELVVKSAANLGLSGFLAPIPEDTAHFRSLLDMPEAPEVVAQPPKPDPEPVKATRNVSGRQRVGHRHAKLSDPGDIGGMGPEGFWRALTDTEKTCALREMDGRISDAKIHVVGLVDKVRQRWVDDLTEQVSIALSDGDPSDVEDIEIHPSQIAPLVGAVKDTFADLWKYGRKSVQDEMRRQKQKARLTEAFRDELLDPSEQLAMFLARSRTFAGRLSRRAEDRARDMALTLFRVKGPGFSSDDISELGMQVVDALETGARLEAQVIVSEAVNMGRVAEADIQKDDIEMAVYSAILDENLCEECAPLDGQEYEVGSEEYYADAPPNKNCLGGNRCRCIYVYMFKTGE